LLVVLPADLLSRACLTLAVVVGLSGQRVQRTMGLRQLAARKLWEEIPAPVVMEVVADLELLDHFFRAVTE
jgi:hypothetical protein